MKVLGVIPSRYASSRFPGKPLADLCGKSMVRRVYEQCARAEVLNQVVVATDDDRIDKHVKDFGGHCIMTSPNHPNGTSRCLEVVEWLEKTGETFDVVINIQGDEPFIEPDQIGQLAGMFQSKETQIASLIHRIDKPEELWSPHVVKVVRKLNGDALYFSRQAIPFLRDEKTDDWLKQAVFFKHLGIYAFRVEVLKQITRLKASALEQAEKLEQLRWLENGYSIKLGITDYEGVGVDTPDDLAKLINKVCE